MLVNKKTRIKVFPKFFWLKSWMTPRQTNRQPFPTSKKIRQKTRIFLLLLAHYGCLSSTFFLQCLSVHSFECETNYVYTQIYDRARNALLLLHHNHKILYSFCWGTAFNEKVTGKSCSLLEWRKHSTWHTINEIPFLNFYVYMCTYIFH